LFRVVFPGVNYEKKKGAIFLDRDGVINHRVQDSYVLQWSDFRFIDGVRQAMKQLSGLNVPLILISNQAAVGKGLLSLETLRVITFRLQESLVADGIFLCAAYYCTHSEDARCDCRKPKPGLLKKAAEDFGVDLSSSVFIGDSLSDIHAAVAAGSNPVLFLADRGAVELPLDLKSLRVVHRAHDLYGATVNTLGLHPRSG